MTRFRGAQPLEIIAQDWATDISRAQESWTQTLGNLVQLNLVIRTRSTGSRNVVPSGTQSFELPQRQPALSRFEWSATGPDTLSSTTPEAVH